MSAGDGNWTAVFSGTANRQAAAAGAAAAGASLDGSNCHGVSGEGGAMREAQRDERSRLDDTVKAADQVLKEHGLAVNATNDQRLRNTLQAAKMAL